MNKETDLVGKFFAKGDDCFVNASTRALWRFVRV